MATWRPGTYGAQQRVGVGAQVVLHHPLRSVASAVERRERDCADRSALCSRCSGSAVAERRRSMSAARYCASSCASDEVSATVSSRTSTCPACTVSPVCTSTSRTAPPSIDRTG
jgi:DnaJ-class molecular chaperone